jgi:TetR/AcrR family transcriptional regulator, regulator of autoinduction and epiphytic fitness
MICSQLLWPQLVRTDFIPPDPTDTTIVDEAVALMLTRYRAGSWYGGTRPTTNTHE